MKFGEIILGLKNHVRLMGPPSDDTAVMDMEEELVRIKCAKSRDP